MAITVICPNLACRSVLQVGDSMRGQKVRCGRCGKNFRVPEPTSTIVKSIPPAAVTPEEPSK
jgi:hypothetical protein